MEPCLSISVSSLKSIRQQSLLLIIFLTSTTLREDIEIERQGSIDGSIKVSYNKLPDYLHKTRQDLSKTKLVFYCAVGERSALAVQLCQSYSLTNINHLIGGIKKWQE